MVIDWHALLFGFTVGAAMSVLFFASLAWSVRSALGCARPRTLLLLSAAGRMAAMLAGIFWVTSSLQQLWPLAGYAVAFFLTRLIAIAWARS